MPLLAVVGAPQQHHALIVLPPCAGDHEPFIPLPPHLGVADMPGAEGGIVLPGQQQALGGPGAVRVAVDADDARFSARVDKVMLTIHLHIAGVDHRQPVVLHHGGTRVHAVAVPRRIRYQRHAVKMPVYKILAVVFAPALQSARRVEGRKLEPCPIDAVVVAQAAGVVQPAYGRHHMKARFPLAGSFSPPLLQAGVHLRPHDLFKSVHGSHFESTSLYRFVAQISSTRN